MFRDPDSSIVIHGKLNIKLKNGQLFNGVDSTTRPYWGNVETVSFWLDDRIRIYPLNDVEYIEMIPGDDDNDD